MRSPTSPLLVGGHYSPWSSAQSFPHRENNFADLCSISVFKVFLCVSSHLTLPPAPSRIHHHAKEIKQVRFPGELVQGPLSGRRAVHQRLGPPASEVVPASVGSLGCGQIYSQAHPPFTDADQLWGQGKPLGSVSMEDQVGGL